MRRFFALLLTLVLALPVSSVACICTEIPVTPVEFLKWVPAADAVFLGRVSEVQYRVWDSGTAQESELSTTVTVIESYKGVEADTEIVIGTYHQSSCEANLSVRSTYLIFAHRAQPDDGHLHVSRCSAFAYEILEGEAPGQNEQLRAKLQPVLEALR